MNTPAWGKLAVVHLVCTYAPPPEIFQLKVGHRPALGVRRTLLFNSNIFLPGFLPVTIVVFFLLGRINVKLAVG